jgi:2-dehydro-3-deoxyphosphogluconate aldolase / (4S)-4-hydroxy-2-oxoglutarate aldolase
MSPRTDEVYERIERERLIAILRPGQGYDASAVLAALADAGVRCAEISLATEQGRRQLPDAVSGLGDRMLLGAGTVRSVADADYARAAGARYLVSPGYDSAVAEWAAAVELAHLPGVLTPTELDQALRRGVRLVKLFPAGRLGPAYVRDLLAVFPAARLVATGAIDAAGAPQFLAAGAVAVALGSALTGTSDPAAVSLRAARVLEQLGVSTPQEA